MEVAVSVNGNSFIRSQAEGDIGIAAGLQCLALTAVPGLHIDPLDKVPGNHGMVHRENPMRFYPIQPQG